MVNILCKFLLILSLVCLTSCTSKMSKESFCTEFLGENYNLLECDEEFKKFVKKHKESLDKDKDPFEFENMEDLNNPY